MGTPARHVAFVAGNAIARAHDATGERATRAVVVAHFNRALESAAGARISRPIERGRGHLAAISGAVTEIAAIVEFGRADDLARIEQVLRIEAVLHLLEGVHQLAAEHLLVKFRADDAVAVLAGMRALVL